MIYKKNFITMDKMNFDLSKKTFKDFEKITNEDAKYRLKSYLFRIMREYQLILLMNLIWNMRILMNKKF